MNFKTPKEVFRPHLITPSASPPPHTLSLKTNDIPPSKRQRLASASRSSSLRRSVSASDTNLDIQKERDASRARLLDAWSQLAERYSRPLDEDDIVDIRTGEIVKDNGFWRTTRQFKFGEVLVPEYQEGIPAEESGDEDGIDELDAFPEEHDYLEDVFAKGLQKAPPVSLNAAPEDEADLEEFLEAEKRRKQEYGSDLEEEIVETCDIVEKGSSSYSPPITHDLHEDDDDEYEEFEGEEDKAGVIQDLPGTSSSAYDSGLENSGSDDELDNWEPTEASMVVITRGLVSDFLSTDEQSDLESEVEIAEPPEPVKNSLPHERRAQPIQLQTPPLSYSSVDQSITGCIDVPLPSPSTPRTNDLPRARRGRSESVSPRKLPAHPRFPTSRRRTKTSPDVIELTDDEDKSEPLSSLTVPPTSPSPPPPHSPTVLSMKCIHSRARSIIPEVVITTSPPVNRIKDTHENPSSKPTLNSPRKSIKQSIISDALSRNTTSMRSPKKPTLVEAPPRPPPTGQRAKSTQATGEAQKTTLSRSKLALRRSPSPFREESARGKLPSSSHVQRESSPEIRGSSVSPVLSTEQSPVCRASSTNISPPKNLANRKRKRSSSAHDNSQFLPAPEVSFKEASVSKSRETVTERASNTRSQGSRWSQSKSRRATLLKNNDTSSSDEGVDHQPEHATRRFASVSATMQNSYSPLPTPSHNPGMYPPAADLRAQQIITSAMQQLAALLWTPPTHSSSPAPVYPYTPTHHHRSSSVGPSFMHSTPDHPHPYPFSFDPSFSKATLPPSSPEIPSSPIKPLERRKSLVSRSRSRGRHVSFYVDDKGGGHSESNSESSTSRPLRSTNKERRGRKKTLSPQRTSSKAKGKQKAAERSLSPFESEADGDEEDQRSVKVTRAKSGRAQTPGPESHSKDGTEASSSRPCSVTKHPLKQRGKHKGGPND